MVVITNKELLTNKLQFYRQKGKKTGFVPTMGALHKGHMALVMQALKENDCVVVSIYVNPTQFDNTEDLKKYPRILDKDRRILEKIPGDILLYVPSTEDIYGTSVFSNHYKFGGLEHQMEGKHRHNHFDGVGTILSLFFEIVKPDRAYFGEKDFQQLQIVKKLVTLKKIPVEIIGHPIVREPNGLAMSSRNKRLTQKQIEAAALIYKTLSEVQKKFKTKSISTLNIFVKEQFLKHPFLKLEYFQIANEKTLVEAKHKRKSNKYRAFIAVFCNDVRLIDNLALN